MLLVVVGGKRRVVMARETAVEMVVRERGGNWGSGIVIVSKQ